VVAQPVAQGRRGAIKVATGATPARVLDIFLQALERDGLTEKVSD
jgi:hypothetical protein